VSFKPSVVVTKVSQSSWSVIRNAGPSSTTLPPSQHLAADTARVLQLARRCPAAQRHPVTYANCSSLQNKRIIINAPTFLFPHPLVSPRHSVTARRSALRNALTPGRFEIVGI